MSDGNQNEDEAASRKEADTRNIDAMLRLAESHRGAFHQRVEECSKVIYGSLAFYVLCVGGSFQSKEPNYNLWAGGAVFTVMILATLEIGLCAKANRINLDFANDAENSVMEMTCPLLKKRHFEKGPTDPATKPHSSAWIFQIVAVWLGGLIAALAMCKN